MTNVLAFPDRQLKTFRVYLVGITLTVKGRYFHIGRDRMEVWGDDKAPVFVAMLDSLAGVEEVPARAPRKRGRK